MLLWAFGWDHKAHKIVENANCREVKLVFYCIGFESLPGEQLSLLVFIMIFSGPSRINLGHLSYILSTTTSCHIVFLL
jgi:hypothetical protein